VYFRELLDGFQLKFTIWGGIWKFIKWVVEVGGERRFVWFWLQLYVEISHWVSPRASEEVRY